MRLSRVVPATATARSGTVARVSVSAAIRSLTGATVATTGPPARRSPSRPVWASMAGGSVKRTATAESTSAALTATGVAGRAAGSGERHEPSETTWFLAASLAPAASCR